MIEFNNVKLNIKSIDILYDLNFSIKENSVSCFVGNKNSGKSSMLKLIAGIYKDYSGDVLISGEKLEYTKKRISMAHEKREKETELNVLEYLVFYGSLVGKEKTEVEIFIDKMLKNFSLMSYKYTNLSMLDEETYKLIDIIRIMIEEPDIILFDNLFSIDSNDFNEKLLSFIKTIIGQKTLLFASRNLKYLENICEYLGVLDAGTLLVYDTISNVFKKADLNRKIEVELFDGMQEAIELLNSDLHVANITYQDNKIIFSIDGDEETENIILKKLIDNNIKVYSFKKENATFEQLFGRIKG